MRNVWIGTSGYTYKDWKGRFYPKTLPRTQWLPYYASQFPTVEINGSFYTSIKKSTYEKWYSMTPGTFMFVLKGHRFITQYKKLHNVEDAVAQFFENASGLQNKLKVVLWQFPSGFGLRTERDLERLEKFLRMVPHDIRHTFEFRSESCFRDEIYDVLKKYNASLVFADSPQFPFHEIFTADFVYIRFHGPGALYASNYPQKSLEQWAEQIREYRKKYDVYCYFNNDMSGHAVNNAKDLGELLLG